MFLIGMGDDGRIKKGRRFNGVLHGKIGPDESHFGFAEHDFPGNVLFDLVRMITARFDVFVPFGKINQYLGRE